mmetsp:Transcript_7030/g.11956  ORF Transcript_7030/g.11956 Transcript_7030/m.11956 type:complete len:233 (-) Transcript_7030:284-982(-)
MEPSNPTPPPGGAAAEKKKAPARSKVAAAGGKNSGAGAKASGTAAGAAAAGAQPAVGLGVVKHPGRPRGKGRGVPQQSTFGGALKGLRGGVVKPSTAPARPVVKAGTESIAASASNPGEVEPADDGFTGTFTKDLPMMMYGFGDDPAPLQETVAVVEGAVLQYLNAIGLRANAIAADSLKSKMDERDVLFVVRKDPPKFARIKELLLTNQVIKRARDVSAPKAADAIAMADA